jgi:DNA (cytosine-5)-methyltransferase 1
MLGFGQYGTADVASTLKARDYKDATDLVVTFVKGTNPHSAEEAPTWRETETAACLNGWDSRHNPPKHVVTFPANLSGTQRVGGESDQSISLQAKNPTAMSDGYTVRKLMPVEYEILQGFPEGYTDIPGATDSARYKALGNSWATPVVRWIGLRIQEAIK